MTPAIDGASAPETTATDSVERPRSPSGRCGPRGHLAPWHRARGGPTLFNQFSCRWAMALRPADRRLRPCRS